MASIEDDLQDTGNSPGEGFLAGLIRPLIFVLLVTVLFGFYYFSQFRGLREAGSMEYAQLARNLSEGNGFVTSCIRPADFWYLSETSPGVTGVAGFPDIRNPPFFPAVLSLGFKLVRPSFELKRGEITFEPEARVIVPLCMFFVVATGGLLYLAGCRLFGRRVAVVSVLVYILSRSVLDDGLSGLPSSLLAFLVTAACCAALGFRDAMARESSFHRFVLFATAAVLCAAAVLTSYRLVVFVPVVVFFMVQGLLRYRWTMGLVFIAVVLLIVSPWLARNWKVSGGAFGFAPYTALQDTLIHAGDSFDRQVAPTVDNEKIAWALKAKLMARLPGILEVNLRTLGNGLAVCLFLVSMFYLDERDDVNALKWGVLVSLLLAAGVAAVFSADLEGAFKPYLPLVVLYGVAFFHVILDRNEFADGATNMLMTGVLILVAALPGLFAVFGQKARIPYPPYFPPFISYVGGLLGPQETLCTDIPWATAWYARRTSILLPLTLDDFRKVSDGKGRISGVYLTPVTKSNPCNNGMTAGTSNEWVRMLEGVVPRDFPLTHGISLPRERPDQVFLTDTNRWEK